MPGLLIWLSTAVPLLSRLTPRLPSWLPTRLPRFRLLRLGLLPLAYPFLGLWPRGLLLRFSPLRTLGSRGRSLRLWRSLPL